jgi:hypothetical protein
MAIYFPEKVHFSLSCSRRRSFFFHAKPGLYFILPRGKQNPFQERASPDFIKKILSKDYNIFLSSSIRRVRATKAPAAAQEMLSHTAAALSRCSPVSAAAAAACC